MTMPRQAVRPLGTGDVAPDFVLPSAEAEGTVSLTEYSSSSRWRARCSARLAKEDVVARKTNYQPNRGSLGF